MFKLLNYYLFSLFLIINLTLIAIPTCYEAFEKDTQQKAYHPLHNDKPIYHSYDQKDNLFTYSSTQLQRYFDYHHYSEKDILSQDMLYISDDFVQLAKTYPGYEKSIKKLYKKLKRLWVFQRATNYLFRGTYYPHLSKRITHLHKELRKYQHVVTENAKSFAQLYDINLLTLYPYKNPLVTRNIYKNYIDILHRASDIPIHNTIIRDCIGQASGIGLEANKHGYTTCASQLADFCFTMLDC